MAYGWNRKVLKVNLTTGNILTEPISEEILKNYLGGRGINIKVLYDTTNKDTDPLGPDNPLIFGTGPLTGTIVPSSGRHNITAKSPLTGILGDSNSGGFWGAELKQAGYDQIIITGKAERPVFLKIINEKVEICNAEHLWGKNVWETEKLIKEELRDDDVQIASIGQAGENLVKISGIMNNLSRAAGRTGMGAVMGSKKLKAVVVRGDQGIGVYDLKRFSESVEEMIQNIYSSPYYPVRSSYGTTMLISLNNRLGNLPYKNSQGAYYHDAEKISGDLLYKKYVTKFKTCFSCPVHCSRYYKVKSGPFAGTQGEGPEYETLVSFGSGCDNSNLESILYINNLCNQYGLDTISTGGVISFAMECYEKGLIKKENANDLDLSWGNYQAIIDLVDKIAKPEQLAQIEKELPRKLLQHLGSLLAEGVKIASKYIPNSKPYALEIKGMEVAAQGVRGIKAMGLGWAVSSRGADHLRAFPIAESLWSEKDAEEVFGTKDAANRFAYKGKARLVKWTEEFSAVTDCLEMCKIVAMPLKLSMSSFAKITSALTGIKFSEEDLFTIGERIVNLERMYNLKMGLTYKEDRVPERFRLEPVPEGNSKGETLDLDKMLPEYYQLRGWDKRGIPTKEKLDELGLSKDRLE
jgi:aldehyde:ferredoxin oxidoreductase